MRLRVLVSLVALVLLAPVSRASSRPRAPLTPKEVAQGYRETVVLAKPRASAVSGAPAAAAMSALSVRDTFPRLGNVQVIEVPAGEDVNRWIKQLERTGQYEFVEPDHVMTVDLLPDDPGFTQQWALRNDGTENDTKADADIDAELAWDIDYDATDVIVAVIDSGARLDHPDLAANLWRNPAPTIGDVHGIRVLDGVRDANLTDEHGHGTGVAGVIGAVGNNGVGLTGVTWKAKLMILKNGNAEGRSVTSDSIACIDYAVANGAKIINCSFGGRGFSNAMFTALKAARDAGVIVVAAAGNNGTNSDTSPHYPANYLLDNIIAVGNSSGADEVSRTSNYGSAVDLFAPGSNIAVLDHKNTTTVRRVSGTSFAAPHVTGALALVRSTYPQETYLQAINRVLRGAELKRELAGGSATNGRLNLYTPLLSGTKTTPHNDEFARRSIIFGSDISIRSNNTGATLETGSGEPLPATGVTSSLWWHWIAAETGRVQITTAGSAYDTALAVYSAGEETPAFSVLTKIASNDDDGAAKTSRVVFDVVQYKSYLVSLAGMNGATGYTQLNISQETPNDHFGNAQLLTGASTRAVGKNRSASMEAGEPAILGLTTKSSIWYKWTAPKTQRVHVSLFTMHFDTLLAIYTGSSLSTLSLVTANDDTDTGTLVTNTDSRCVLNAVAGTTYYFQAASTSDRTGDVTIAITDSLWQFSSGGGEFSSSPAIAADGTLYVGSGHPDNTLYAVNPDGSLKWIYLADGSLDLASPAVGADGTIYQTVWTGQVLAVNPDGMLKWKRTFDQTMSGGVAIAADGTLYCHTNDGRFYALNPADGTTRWSQQTGAKETFAGCAIAPDGTIYQPSDSDNFLYALNPDGTVKWRTDIGGTTFSTPALDALGNIYVATYSSSRVLSLTPAGIIRWTYADVVRASQISSSPVLSGDGQTVYIGAGDEKLHAISAQTGVARWTYECGSYIYAASPAVDANGVIYIGCYDGKLYGVNSDGTLKRTWDFGEIIRGSPLIAGTTLYLGANDQKLYAFDIGASAAGGPWPQFRHGGRRQGRAVTEPLSITVPPDSAVLTLGETRTLQVVAQGAGPLAFQWAKDGIAIAGATGSRLVLANVTAASAGSYTVTVSGPQGSVTSTAAVLSLPATEPTDPGTPDTRGRVINLSVRCRAGSGAKTVIVGMSIGPGTGGDKPLLLRGMGPTLVAHGVTDAIPDPMLTVFSGSAAITANDGWRGDPVISAAAARLYAFPFASNTSLDAAMYTALPSGAYTVQITGKTGNGISLVELYDGTETAALTATAPRLLNVSARTHVGLGGDVLIAGFTVNGGSERLLIRAVGPKLAEYGVTGVLANPKLELYRGDNKISENDDWGGTAEIADAAKQVWAFPLDATSKDACMLVTLPAGIYSAVVKGVGDTTGVALVEVYALP